jgi:DNA polymerase III sliding clamp (beta) subunit (PCNA family)
MKVKIATKTFRDALTRIAHIPGAHTGAPHTQAVTMTADMAGLTLTRFTSESRIQIIVDEVTVEEEGDSIVLRHDSLSSMISRFGANDTLFHTDEKFMHFVSGSAKAKLALFSDDIDAEPPEPELETESIKLPLEDLREIMSVVKSVVGKDPNRPALTGVCVRMMAGKLCFIGSDGRRAHIVMTDYAIDVNCIISGDGVDAMLKALHDECGGCTFAVGESTVQIFGSNVEISLALINEKYPNIEPFLTEAEKESSIQSKVTVNRDEFAASLKTCSSVGHGEARFVTLDVRKTGLNIIANNKKDSDISVSMKCTATKAVAIGVPSLQLASAIEILPTDESGQITVIIGIGAVFLKGEDRFAFVALAKPETETK